ncbi:MAG: hypothetical protein K6A97_05705 [Lachnospiraceae bacterium]|nr:hypothetical protein [Lachnospiraceae bacterium]
MIKRIKNNDVRRSSIFDGYFRGMRKPLRGLLSVFMIFAMLVGGLPCDLFTLYANADAVATVYTVHVDENDPGLSLDPPVPTSAQVSQCYTDDISGNDRAPMIVYVKDGTYTARESDIVLPKIVLDNATVDLTQVNLSNYHPDDTDVIMWGNSKAILPGVEVSYSGTELADNTVYETADNSTALDIAGTIISDVQKDATEANKVTTYTANCAKGTFEEKNIVVNENVTLTLNEITDDSNPQNVRLLPALVRAKNLTVKGTIVMSEVDENCEGPNFIEIDDSGSFTVTGSITPADGSVIALGEKVTVSGINLYDDAESTTPLSLTGTDDQGRERFIYDATASKWVRDGGQQGPQLEDVTLDADYRPEGNYEVAALVVNAEATLSIGTIHNADPGEDQSEYEGGFVYADSVDIYGTISILAPENGCEEANILQVRENGFLKIETGGVLTAVNGALLQLEHNVTVTGLTLYDRGENDEPVAFVSSGSTTDGFERYEWDATESKWMRCQEGNNPPPPEDGFSIRIVKRESGSGTGSVTLTQGGLTITNGTALNDGSINYVFDSVDDVSGSDPIVITGTPTEGSVLTRVFVGQAEDAINDTAVQFSGKSYTLDAAAPGQEYYYEFNFDEDRTEFAILVPAELDSKNPDVCGKIDVTGNFVRREFVETGNYNKYVFLRNDYRNASVIVAPKEGSNCRIDKVYVKGVEDTSLSNTEKIEGKTYTISGEKPAVNEEILFSATFTIDEEQMLKDIEGHEYAYYPGDGTDSEKIAKVKKYLAQEIWYEYFGLDRKYIRWGIYEDMDALKANLSATPSDIKTETGLTNGLEGMQYIEFTMTARGVGHKIKVYLLNTPRDFMIEIGGNRVYRVLTAHENGEDMIFSFEVRTDQDGREEGVYIFGNGACAVGNLNPSNEEYVIGWHITQEHSQLMDDQVIGGIACRLILSKGKADSSTIKVQGSENAGGWAFADLEYFGATGTKDNPGEATVFMASTEVEISDVTFENSENATISNVAVDTSSISDKAASVAVKNGKFVVSFNTGYDDIPLVLTMSDGSKRYLVIKRVAVYIGEGSSNGDSVFDLFHSTSAVKYSGVIEPDSRKVIYGTYYYTTGHTEPTPDQRVDLFVTITTTEGVIKKVISKEETITYHDGARDQMDPNDPNFVKGYLGTGYTNSYYDDFIFWEGSEEDFAKILKVEAIAYDVGNKKSFGGVKAGSGTGAKWTRQNFGH